MDAYSNNYRNNAVTDPVAMIGNLSFLWLEITQTCNLVCQHCYTDSSPRRPLDEGMSLADWVTVLEQARKVHCDSVQFIGGEPMLHPQLMTLVECASNLGFRYIEIYSNGTRIDKAMAARLKQFGVRVALSVYSAEPAVHDRITGKTGSHARTMRAIRHLREADVPVRASVVEFDPANLQNAGVTALLSEIGVTDVRSDHLRKVGRGGQHSGDIDDELCGGCWRGRLCITASGNTYPCVFSRHVDLGDIHDGLPVILGSERLHSFRHSHRLRSEKLDRANEVGCGKGCQPECLPGVPCRPGAGPCTPQCSPSHKPPPPEPCAPSQCQPDRGSCIPDRCNPNLC